MENEAKVLLSEGRNCIIIWKKKLWLIVAMAIIGLVIGNFLTVGDIEDEYTATTKVASYTIDSEYLMAYGYLITSLNYCEQAAEMLNDDFITAERIREMVSVSTNKSIPIVEINVSDIDGSIAAKVANALAKVAVNEINQKLGVDSAQILEEASVNLSGSAVVLSTLIRIGCMILAAFATMVFLGIKAIISKKIVLVEDFTCGGELTVIGMIPLYEDGKS